MDWSIFWGLTGAASGLAAVTRANRGGLPDGWTAHEFNGAAEPSRGRKYLLRLPENPAGPHPLIVFLHGAGERGNDPRNVLNQGLPRAVKRFPGFPFMVLAPQCPPGMYWRLPFLEELMDHVLNDGRTDRHRVYLTGISMGGYAVWALAARHPEWFAAIAPVCGGGNPRQARRLKDLPIWAFHGRRDPIVPVTESEQMVDSVRAAGGIEVRFTVYPATGHDSWTRTYRNPDLYQWFLAHHRNG